MVLIRGMAMPWAGTVVQIRIMRVPVCQRRVEMAVGMGFGGVRARRMVVLVVVVMPVAVFMVQRLMPVVVFVPFGQV
jgi:hypothetical protein